MANWGDFTSELGMSHQGLHKGVARESIWEASGTLRRTCRRWTQSPKQISTAPSSPAVKLPLPWYPPGYALIEKQQGEIMENSMQIITHRIHVWYILYMLTLGVY